MIQKIYSRKTFLKMEQTLELAFTDTTVLVSWLLWYQLSSNPKVNQIFVRGIPFQHYIKISSSHKRETAIDKLRIPD